MFRSFFLIIKEFLEEEDFMTYIMKKTVFISSHSSLVFPLKCLLKCDSLLNLFLTLCCVHTRYYSAALVDSAMDLAVN